VNATIKINTRGRIITGENAGWYVTVVDDQKNTGGYLVLVESDKNDDEGYDYWVANRQQLEDAFKVSWWEVEWGILKRAD
jgi:hypothetical protein